MTVGDASIVRKFLAWVRTAPVGRRAEATGALARAFLYSPLAPDEQHAALSALTLALEDSSFEVRRALAEAFATHPRAPQHIVLALARDVAEVSTVLLCSSPVLLDLELIDVLAEGDARVQAAIAGRPVLSAALCGAIAEVGGREACLVMIANPGAVLTGGIFGRLVERFGAADAAVREALLAREDLPIGVRQSLVMGLIDQLSGLVVDRAWVRRERAEAAARDQRERATVSIAVTMPHGVPALVRHLRGTQQLTASLLLRAILLGAEAFTVAVLADLADVAESRVQALLRDRQVPGIAALLQRAGLPRKTQTPITAALQARTVVGWSASERPGQRRWVIERALAEAEADGLHGLDPLVSLLRRLCAEAAREEAAENVAGLVAEEAVDAGRATAIGAGAVAAIALELSAPEEPMDDAEGERLFGALRLSAA